jgi:uncharacterized membrane protein
MYQHRVSHPNGLLFTIGCGYILVYSILKYLLGITFQYDEMWRSLCLLGILFMCMASFNVYVRWMTIRSYEHQCNCKYEDYLDPKDLPWNYCHFHFYPL